MVTVENLSQATVTEGEGAVKQSDFTGDLSQAVDAARDCSNHITSSPLFAGLFEEPMVFEEC